MAGYFGQRANSGLHALFDLRHIHAGMRQEGGAAAVVIIQQGFEYVYGFQIAAIARQCHALAFLQGLLEFGGEFVESHCLSP